MEELTKEDINLLLYTLKVYMFESGDESEEVLSLRLKLISIYKEEEDDDDYPCDIYNEF